MLLTITQNQESGLASCARGCDRQESRLSEGLVNTRFPENHSQTDTIKLIWKQFAGKILKVSREFKMRR